MTSRRRALASFVCGAVMASAFAVAISYRPTVAQEQTHVFKGTGDVRFDESLATTKGPLPVVPKTWRFVAASNGEKTNSTNLWFEDKDGQIYMLQGFTSLGQFTIFPAVQRLNRR